MARKLLPSRAQCQSLLLSRNLMDKSCDDLNATKELRTFVDQLILFVNYGTIGLNCWS